MDVITRLRVSGTNLKKLYHYTKYSMKYEKMLQSLSVKEQERLRKQTFRSINLLDLRNIQESYSLKPRSDATEYGGESKVELKLQTDIEATYSKFYLRFYSLS